MMMKNRRGKLLIFKISSQNNRPAYVYTNQEIERMSRCNITQFIKLENYCKDYSWAVKHVSHQSTTVTGHKRNIFFILE